MARSTVNWPDWWEWELDCSNPHLAKRMIDRSFTETDVRTMLETASGLRSDTVAGRFVVETAHNGRRWEVVVEPDDTARLLVVVTAYSVE